MKLEERFEILRLLGEGASGKVVEVCERSTGDRYALKLVELGEGTERVRRELAMATRVEHPHVLRCFEAGVSGTRAWLLLELADGSLQERLAGGAPVADTWELLRQVGRGLGALHAAGLVHRDLKPANVMLVGGAARIADLGLSRAVDMRTMTATGTILGTPAYMAPEQAKGERAGPAADVWSLGVMFYELIEGRVPYPSDLSTGDLLVRVARGQVDPFGRAHTLVAAAQLEVLKRCLSLDPGRRPADPTALAEDLGPSRPPSAEPASEGTLILDRDGPAGPTRALAPRKTESLGEAPATAVLPDLGVATTPVSGTASSVESSSARVGTRRGWRLAAGMGFLVLLGGAALRGPGSEPRAVLDPTPTPADQEPGPARRLGHEWFLQLEEDIARAGEAWRDPGGGRLLTRADAEGVEGSTRLLDDPHSWVLVRRELPSIRDFYDRLASRELDPALLDDEETARLRRADARFQSRGFPPPFEPFLQRPGDVTQARVDPDHRERISAGPILRAEPPPAVNGIVVPTEVSGWLAVACRALGKLCAASAARGEVLGAAVDEGRNPVLGMVEEVAGGIEFTDDTWAAKKRAALLVLNQDRPEDRSEVLKVLARAADSIFVRRALQETLGEAFLELRRFLYALARALEEDPGRRDEAVVLVERLNDLDDTLWAQGHAFGRPEDLLGFLPGGPAGRFLRAEVRYGRGRIDTRGLLAREEPGTDLMIDDFQASMGDPPAPGGWNPRFSIAYSRFINVAWRAGRCDAVVQSWRELREHWLRLPYTAGFGDLAFLEASCLLEEGEEVSPREAAGLLRRIEVRRTFGGDEPAFWFRRYLSDGRRVRAPVRPVLDELRARASGRSNAFDGASLPDAFPLWARIELHRSEGVWWGPDGLLRDADWTWTVPDGEVPFLDRDPLAWGTVRTHLPEVRRFERWIAAGGEPASLERETREALRGVGREYASRGLPDPFGPWIDVAPSGQERAISEVVRERVEDQGYPDAARARGWLGAAYHLLSAALERDAEDMRRLLEHIHGASLGKLTESPFLNLRDLKDRAEEAYVHPGKRVGLTPLLREGVEAVLRGYHAGFRSLVEEPATREEAAAALILAVKPLRAYLHSHVPWVDVDAWTRGHADDPHVALVLAQLRSSQGRILERVCDADRGFGEEGCSPRLQELVGWARRQELDASRRAAAQGVEVFVDLRLRALATNQLLWAVEEAGTVSELESWFDAALGVIRDVEDARALGAHSVAVHLVEAVEGVTDRGGVAPTSLGRDRLLRLRELLRSIWRGLLERKGSGFDQDDHDDHRELMELLDGWLAGS